MSPGHISNGPSESSGDIDDWHRFLLDSEPYLGGLADVRCAKVAEDVVRVLGRPFKAMVGGLWCRTFMWHGDIDAHVYNDAHVQS